MNLQVRSVFFSEVIFTLLRLYFAHERGFTPYVKWGEECFLYYFEQVSHVKDINSASYVVESAYEHIHSFDTHGYDITDLYMTTLASMVKKYLRYNSKTKAFLEIEYDMLIGDRKALAVHFRGTDYRRQYNNHPVFVTIEQEIKEIHKLINKSNYEIIFWQLMNRRQLMFFVRSLEI